jgi:hypothetical protein
MALAAGSAAAEELLSSGGHIRLVSGCGDECCDEPCGGESLDYGPCACRPRGTLLQWSYGTSFEGGPNLDEPISTDRPDFTETSVTVGRGVVQLETGYTYTYDSEGGESVRTHDFPEALLRVGMLAEWFELRLGQNFLDERTRSGGGQETLSGAEDLYLGIKLALTPQEGILPEMALTPQMTVPTGSSEVSDDNVLPGINWLYGWDITENFSAAGSTQGNRARDDAGEYYFEFAQSATVGIGLTERLGGYAEWYAFFPHSAVTALPEHYFNGGFTFKLTDNLQLDVRAGVGLNRAADDYFVGTGLSMRF